METNAAPKTDLNQGFNQFGVCFDSGQRALGTFPKKRKFYTFSFLVLSNFEA
jgi:hypothetical protein